MENEVVTYLLIGQIVLLTGIFFRLGGVREAMTDIKRRLDVLESIVLHNTKEEKNQ